MVKGKTIKNLPNILLYPLACFILMETTKLTIKWRPFKIMVVDIKW